MTFTLLRDAKDHPHAFRWNGAVPVSLVEKWLGERGWIVPPELVELWTTLGGGEFFESETVLQPCGDGDDNIDEENEALISMGMQLDLLVFHRGLCISAIEQDSGQVVTLDAVTYRRKERFSSIEDWYIRVIRDEFADRYGIDGL